MDELVVAKGRRVLRFALGSERPSDEELLALMLGRSGSLRAPTMRVGKRLLVGYNQDILASVLA